MAKISIVGAGQVGAEVGFALADGGLAQEIVIVDINIPRAEGVALDIAHGVPMMRPVEVRAGEYSAVSGSELVILTAGAGQKPEQSRTALYDCNRTVVECACREIVRFAPDCVLLVVTNPVDMLTGVAANCCGFPRGRVLGSGTVLDSLRMRAMIAAHTGVDARDVHAWVLGEHGDSEVPAWSVARVGGLPIDEFCQLCADCAPGLEARLRSNFYREVRDAAYEIIRGKGATSHGVAVAVRRIAEAVLRDERSVLTVSTPLNGEYGLTGVALSLPSVVGRRGVERVLPLRLTPAEQEALRQSAQAVRQTAFQRDFHMA